MIGAGAVAARPAVATAATPTVRSTSSKLSYPSGFGDVLTLPSGVAAGDLLLIFFVINASVTLTTPSGWSLVASSSTTVRTAIYSRIADGSEGASVTVTMSSMYDSRVALLAAVQGVNTTTPVAVSTLAEASDSITATGSLTNTAVKQLMLVWQASGAYDTTAITVTPSSGYTELVDISASGGYRQGSLSTKDLDPGVGSNSVSLALSNYVSRWVVHMLAINPA